MSGSQNTVQNSADVWTACCHLSGTQCDEQTANRTADGLQISIRACSYKQLSSRCSVMIVRSLSYSLFYALLNTQSRCRCVSVCLFQIFYQQVVCCSWELLQTWWLMSFPASTCYHCVCVRVCGTERETDGPPRPVVYDTFSSLLATLRYIVLSHKRLPAQTHRAVCHASVSPQ